MMDHLSLFASDADQWEADGMTHEDEDALVLALWRWYRGRPSADGLPVSAKVLYSYIVRQREAQDRIYSARSEAGKRGMASRWHGNGFVNNKPHSKRHNKSLPTATATATATSTATSTATATVESGGTGADAPKPPAPTRERFSVPSVDEVRTYCEAQGFADVDAVRFVDYYESKGWRVGKAPMKDWMAAVRNWHRREAEVGGGVRGRSRGVGIYDDGKETVYGLPD